MQGRRISQYTNCNCLILTSTQDYCLNVMMLNSYKLCSFTYDNLKLNRMFYRYLTFSNWYCQILYLRDCLQISLQILSEFKQIDQVLFPMKLSEK